MGCLSAAVTATATGVLTASVARREYRWFWHDALGRIKTEGFYGTNGGVEMCAPYQNDCRLEASIT